MAELSASGLFKRAADQMSSRLSAIDIDALTKEDQRALKDLKRLLADVRLDLRDYEYADTRSEMLGHANEARLRIERLHGAVLAATDSGVFGAADVAQLTAQLDAVTHKL